MLLPTREELVASATRVFLRPLATPLPLGFLALMLSTTTFAVVELGWVPAAQNKVAALVAVVLTAPLQLLSAVLGFLARDPVAGTGVAVLSGTWAVIGVTTLLSPPGAHSPGLGVLLVCAGVALLVPARWGCCWPLSRCMRRSRSSWRGSAVGRSCRWAVPPPRSGRSAARGTSRSPNSPPNRGFGPGCDRSSPVGRLSVRLRVPA
ncbi:hypothetical protein HC031_21630 [Planosporangium thailandense]|uniref:Uncharacterized protein n=1 Tax=Planosporangium thailandense TaxID=765197 RepID=A0ABX0Y2I3_9ACTN|nr:hypothetical protein [Planosporangium thailandense]NJC72296.1 hypothetical protein [Planosporangium thailandense]